MERYLQPELAKLPEGKTDVDGRRSGFYGLLCGGRLCGACGIESMLAILRAIFADVECYDTGKGSSLVVAKGLK